MQALEFVNKVLKMMSYPKVDTIEGTVDIETEKAIDACNDVLAAVQNDQDWQELATVGYVETEAAESFDATFSISYGGTTLVSSVGNFTTSHVGKLLMVSGEKVAYTILTWTDPFTVVLNRAWVGDNLNDARTVTIGQNVYEFPTDFHKLTVDRLYNPIAGNYVQVVDPQELSRKRVSLGLGLVTGAPEKCTLLGMNATGTAQKVHLDRCPGENYTLEFNYQRNHPQLSANTDEVLYPPKEILGLLDMIKARLARDNELAQTAAQTAQEAIIERAKQQQSGRSGGATLRLTPDTLTFGRSRRRGW